MFHVLLAVPLSYLLLTLGATLPVRMGSRNDVSYGVYIYAPVVTNILIQLGAQDLGLLPSAALTLVFTLPCAWASWLLVERPALGLAKRMTHGGQPVTVSQPA
jgi:peptidoglycan/LPS O-acetylase OafA/YrhL